MTSKYDDVIGMMTDGCMLRASSARFVSLVAPKVAAHLPVPTSIKPGDGLEGEDGSLWLAADVDEARLVLWLSPAYYVRLAAALLLEWWGCE